VHGRDALALFFFRQLARLLTVCCVLLCNLGNFCFPLSLSSMNMKISLPLLQAHANSRADGRALGFSRGCASPSSSRATGPASKAAALRPRATSSSWSTSEYPLSLFCTFNDLIPWLILARKCAYFPRGVLSKFSMFVTLTSKNFQSNESKNISSLGFEN
jgi:hypothetical protein